MADQPRWEDLFGTDPDESPRATTPTPQPTPAPHAPPPASAPLPSASVPSATAASTPIQPAASTPTRVSERREAPPRRSSRQRPPRHHRRRLTWVIVLVVVLGLIAGGGATVWSAFGPQIRHVLGLNGSTDYTGSGDGKVATITILHGQFGSDVAKSLQKAGVIKTSSVFYTLLLKQTPSPSFEPGIYTLQKQMSAKAALAALLNPKNHTVSKVVIPEGSTMSQFFTRLSKGTGVSVADFQAAAKNYTALGVPANAPSLEGFLFPATYQFDPGLNAQVILKTLVTRMYQSLDAAGVAPADRLRVLTLASIVQREGGSTADFYKVARVFQNRLDQNMALQSDATVNYGAGKTTITTTTADRADASNKYNTYANKGLPIGPIASPGDDAIKAALHPVAGTWLYFVLVNGDTKETVFSTTLAQHNAAVAQWQAWLKAHPGYGQ